MTLTAVSAKRQTDPQQLSALVRGELDWIVMKCLEKDRTRRYETANGLARDIERYLKDEPVEACPPSPLYRLRKFTRRNRVAVFLTSFVAATVAAVSDQLFSGTAAGQTAARPGAGRGAESECGTGQSGGSRQSRRPGAPAGRCRGRRCPGGAGFSARTISCGRRRSASSRGQLGFRRRQPVSAESDDQRAARPGGGRADAGKDRCQVPQSPLRPGRGAQSGRRCLCGSCGGEGHRAHCSAPSSCIGDRAGRTTRATLAARHSLAMALFMDRQDAAAAKLLAEVYADRVRLLGPYHADTFATRDYLGDRYLATKDPAGNSVLRATRGRPPEAFRRRSHRNAQSTDSISAAP